MDVSLGLGDLSQYGSGRRHRPVLELGEQLSHRHVDCPRAATSFAARDTLSSPDQAGTTTYPSDPSPTNIARTLSESSGVRVSIRSCPARPSSSFSV